MATKNKVTIYFPDPEENELWDAIQAIPKGVRGVVLRDILRESLINATPKLGLFLSKEPAPKEVVEEKPQPKEPEVDKKVALEIPIFKRKV